MADDPTDPETEATDDGATTDAGPVIDDAPAETSTPDDDRNTAADVEADPVAKTKATSKASGATPAPAAGNVVRKKVVSKRVTPKGGPVSTRGSGNAKPGNAKPQSKAAKAAAVEDDEFQSRRYTPPSHNDMLPSPWWVPALMFGLLIVGAVIIMANYMGAFGDAENVRLVIGLAFILGGIITATQYR